jgi:hypothetical protein
MSAAIQPHDVVVILDGATIAWGFRQFGVQSQKQGKSRQKEIIKKASNFLTT